MPGLAGRDRVLPVLALSNAWTRTAPSRALCARDRADQGLVCGRLSANGTTRLQPYGIPRRLSWLGPGTQFPPTAMDNHWRCRRCSPTAKPFNPAPASMACSGLMGCPVPIFYLTRDGPTKAAGKLEGPATV